MSFPIKLTSVLTGATVAQLNRWRGAGLLVPELPRGPRGEVRYSFRDLIALRTVAKLRAEVSLQAIRRALENLDEFQEPAHLSAHRLVINEVGGKTSVALLEGAEDDETGTDLVRAPGQTFTVGLWQVFRTFRDFRGDPVVDFERPAEHLEVVAGRVGGWPTIARTRIGFDQIANLQRGPEALRPEEISEFFPLVSAEAALDAVQFDDRVHAAGGAA